MSTTTAADDMAASEASSPLVASILDGSAPRAIRLAAARGALPVSRPVLIRLLVALAGETDDEVRAQARKSLDAWPRDEMLAMGADESSDPAVLAWLLGWPGADTTLLASILSNRSTPMDAVTAAARSFSAEGLDTLLLNQTLLIEHPQILDEIESNRSATPLQRTKVDEVRRHFLAPAAAPRPTPPPEAQSPHAAAPSPPDATPTFATTGSPAPCAPAHAAGLAPPAAPGAAPTEPEASHAPETVAREGVMARILKMNVNEKIALAQKGTREERSILIRDTNRSVQDAVLNSPKLSENEVEGIARTRSVNEDILRQIAANRDWMKHYSVVLGLVSNPKTPLGISLSLLQRLTTRDLKLILTDKNVPDALRRQARKIVEIRVTKPGSGPGR